MKSILRSTALVGSMTLISRILGFCRDLLLAYTFGATATYDAFLLAFRIPNFLRRLFAEGAFSQAFIPVLAEQKQEGQSVQSFLNKVTGTLLSCLLVISLLGSVTAAYWVQAFAPGFAVTTAKGVLATQLLHITFPYILFISLSALFAGILNSYQHFAIPAVTPVFLNVALIIGACWGIQFFQEPIMALAWAVLGGGVLQVVFQLPFLARLGILLRPIVAWQDPAVRKICCLMLPAILGVAVNQINILIDTMFASFLPTGSLSWLYYAERLMELPLGVFGIALSTVVFPKLTSHHSAAEPELFARTMTFALKLICLIGIPVVLLLYWLAEPIMSTLFLRGAFTVFDVKMAARALQAYVVGSLALMFTKVLAVGFYARQDTKTPVKYALVVLGTNIILNALFVRYWAHVGLALATSCAAILHAALLYVGLRRRQMAVYGWADLSFLLKIIVSAGTMAASLVYLVPDITRWQAWELVERITYLGAVISAAAAIFVVSLWCLGARPRHL